MYCLIHTVVYVYMYIYIYIHTYIYSTRPDLFQKAAEQEAGPAGAGVDLGGGTDGSGAQRKLSFPQLGAGAGGFLSPEKYLKLA